MTIFSRSNNQVCFNFESGTFGVPLTAGSFASGLWMGLVTSNTPTENENLKVIRYTGTASRNLGQIVVGPKDYDGSTVFHPQNWRMLAFALGSCVDTSGTVSSHIISELEADGLFAPNSGTTCLTNFPSFTLRDTKKGIGDGFHFTRTFNGCVVDKFVLSMKQGAALECTIDWKGQSLTIGSKSTEILNLWDADTSRPYVWSDVTLFLPSGAANVMNEVTDANFTIENNTQVRHYVNGSRVAQAFVPTMRNYALDLTLDANSTWGQTLENYHKNGSIFNGLLQVQQSGNEYISITMSGCQIMTFQAPSEAEGIDTFKVKIQPKNVVATGSEATKAYISYA